MKKILIRTAIVVVSVFALFVIVSATNTASENKKAKAALTEEMALKGSCCDTAISHPGCDPENCTDKNCDPANCNKPACEKSGTASASCDHAKTTTAAATPTAHKECGVKCGKP